jgi:hypothetical protein
MADFDTTLNSKIENLLARFGDADGAKSSAQIAVSGGEATSIKLNMSANEGKNGAPTILSARVEAEKDGAAIFATGDTATGGENASASLELNATLQEKLALAEVIAKGDGAVTTATASPEFEIVNFKQDTVEADGDNPTISRTYLEVVGNESFAPEPLPLSEESTLIETGNADWLF